MDMARERKAGKLENINQVLQLPKKEKKSNQRKEKEKEKELIS